MNRSPDTPPSKPMRPALLRRRASRSYAFSDQRGTLSRTPEGGYQLKVNAYEVRELRLPAGHDLPPALKLPARVRVTLWPRTDDQANVVWHVASLLPDEARGRRQATYISGDFKALRKGGYIVVTIRPAQVPPFDLTLRLGQHLTFHLSKGERVLLHAHQQEGRLVAHHVLPVPPPTTPSAAPGDSESTEKHPAPK